MDPSNLVALPTSKTSRKKAKNGTVYIYYRTRFYRDERGKASFDEVSIGKLDLDTGLLIPNRNYHELFMKKNPSSILPKCIQSAGIGLVCDHLAKMIGLKQVLQTHFPHQANTLLALAYYMLDKGNVIHYAADWLEETAIPLDIQSLSSQSISQLFSQLTLKQRLTFFDAWTKLRGEQDYWVYDVTSISSYARGIEQVEWGYNRDQDALPQLNLGICYGHSSQLPLFYQLNNGSIPDKTFFPYVLKSFPFLSSDSVHFVVDQGFLTKTNLEAVTQGDNPYQVLSFLPHHWKDTVRIIEHKGIQLKSARHYLPDLQVYGMTLSEEVQGIPVNVHLYYDSEKANLESKLVYDRIQHLEKEIQSYHHSALNKKCYQQYFKIDVPKTDVVTYEVDYDAIDQQIARCGYFALVSTESKLTAAQALRVYREKDQIEKVFDDLKNGMDFKRFRTHTQETTEGKVFIAFLSLIIRRALLNQFAAIERKDRLSLPTILTELRKIKQVETADGERHYMPLTGKQKKILKVIGIDSETLTINQYHV